MGAQDNEVRRSILSPVQKLQEWLSFLFDVSCSMILAIVAGIAINAALIGFAEHAGPVHAHGVREVSAKSAPPLIQAAMVMVACANVGVFRRRWKEREAHQLEFDEWKGAVCEHIEKAGVR